MTTPNEPLTRTKMVARRVTLAGVLALTNSPLLLILVMFLGAQMTVSINSVAPEPSFLWSSIAVLTTVLALNLFVLFTLTRIGGPLKADLKATVKKFGGSIVLTSVGLMGAFLALMVISLLTLVFFIEMHDRGKL